MINNDPLIRVSILLYIVPFIECLFGYFIFPKNV